jgi:threonine/homoserine/homoserine lactone efflux protein
MYGTWFMVTFGVVFVVLFVVAIAASAWAPFLALVIAGLLFVPFLLWRGWRRGQSDREVLAARRDAPSRGAPRSGEGA